MEEGATHSNENAHRKHAVLRAVEGESKAQSDEDQHVEGGEGWRLT